jgi:hypothetical protein
MGPRSWTFGGCHDGKFLPEGVGGLSPGFNSISANLMRGPWVDEWLLSRRDRLIVARHECLDSDTESAPSRRDGRSHCQSQCQQNRFNRPAGTGPFSSRHFVPGYYRALPPGQKTFAHRNASHYLSARNISPLQGEGFYRERAFHTTAVRQVPQLRHPLCSVVAG